MLVHGVCVNILLLCSHVGVYCTQPHIACMRLCIGGVGCINVWVGVGCGSVFVWRVC